MTTTSPRGRRSIRVATVALFASISGSFGVAACGGDDEPRAETPLDALAYAAVLRELVPGSLDEPTPPVDDDVVPVVFVWAPVDPALSLEDQTRVIDDMSETYDVRFVDEVAAAVDDDTDGRPPHDDGVLVGIGALSTEPPVKMRVELYLGDDRVTGHRVTLVQRDGTWMVIRDEPVEPEMLGDDD